MCSTPDKKLNFPKSVVEMMQGTIGLPEGGWPKVLQKIILDSAGVKPIKGRPGQELPKVDFVAIKRELAGKIHREPTDDRSAVLPDVSAGVPGYARSI